MIALGVFALPFDDPAGFTAPPAFGPFRVLHQIGSGALGPVFRTFDSQQEKLVAVKVFRLDVIPETSVRLADALARMAEAPLNHPAVVKSVAAGIEGTTAYLAMEYVAAETLDVGMRRLAPAQVERAMPLLSDVADAIEAAWAVGMGHGALHPRDIFVLPASADVEHASTVRVTGFGVTDALEALRIPTPARRPYSAPEREGRREWDIRADVYSLGVIAHELLTGQRPAGSSDSDDELPGDTDLPETVRRALACALANDPAQRFETPTAFVTALRTGVLPVVAGMAHEPAAGTHDVDETEDEDDARASIEEADVPRAAPSPPRVEAVRSSPSESQRDVTLSTHHRREPFQPNVLVAQDRDPSRVWGTAALIVLALAAGTGFGYWLRGRTPATEAVSEAAATLPVTKVPDEPIGTEVAVASAAPNAAPAATPGPPPPAPVSEDPAPAPTLGRMLVRSEPSGATVSINGRERGTTPATLRNLPFGTYTVAVARPGYQRREQRVVLNSGTPAREITMDLKGAPQAEPATRATKGWVYVDTRPTGATVSIDGRVVGKAPMRVAELSPGDHIVRLTLAGHKPMTTKVTVRAGQQTDVRVSLEIQ